MRIADRRRRSLVAAGGVLAALLLAGCGAVANSDPAPSSAKDTNWSSTLAHAKGQTVRVWMYGGDPRVNAYIDQRVAPALQRQGVKLRRVPVTDTADAVDRVIAERRAGRNSGGGVDVIWINGENFAAGKKAGLWLRDWSTTLPNAKRYINRRDPSISTDFQVPVDGQEAPWWRAAFLFAYDRARTPQPPRTFDQLLAWAKAHPGRFTYPAPPDYTGSSFLRQVVAAKGEAGAFAYLKALKPYQYRQGKVFPKSQEELEQLFGDGQVDLAMAYDPNFVSADVKKGLFPKTARPLVIGSGALQNVSFLTIPANAAHVDGAKVLVNLMLSPSLQAQKADPNVLGNPSVLDPRRLGAEAAALQQHTTSPYVLRDLGRPVTEFAAARVAPLERRWRQEVLR